MKRVKLALYMLLLLPTLTVAQPTERPFIWATNQDKAEILHKIENYDWAQKTFTALKERADRRIEIYTADKDLFFSKFALDWQARKEDKFPPYRQLSPKSSDAMANKEVFMSNIQFITDCSIIYYLTGEEKYAQVTLDILYTMTMALEQTPRAVDNRGTGGWVYPSDLLSEARFVSAIPVAYDFIYPFIAKGAKAYDITKCEYQTPSLETFQYVFKEYARMVAEHGHAGSNWSVLEGSTLVNCALALDDLNLRNKFLDIYLYTSNDTQSSLKDIASRFAQIGDIWPETSQYSNDVSHMSSYIMYVMTKYNPELHLAHTYKAIPWALPRWLELVHPNGDVINFGDGLRYVGVSPEDYEPAYALAVLDNEESLKERIGSALAQAIKEGYQRPNVSYEYSAPKESYYLPTALLWGAATIEGSDSPIELPRTDALSHAGLFLQRNLSDTGKNKDDLMLTVAGASHVHSHAGGMNIELYGKGCILGADNGRLNYQQDIHENYSRLYAAHNTVVSNGKSSSMGDWVNLGTATVEKVSMEPEPWTNAIANNYSYSTTSFVDHNLDQYNASHQRTLSIVRTSASSGYYIDIFRARSEHEEDQFHDYIYHNISDRLVFDNDDLEFEATPDRYMECATKSWVRNREYRHPGWHFFEDVETSKSYADNVEGIFCIDSLKEEMIGMKFFIMSEDNREYTKVVAPQTFSMSNSYKDKPTPTFVIRKQGDAWDQPFAVIYEPVEDEDGGCILSVERLEQGGVFKGFCVESKVDGKKITQYIICQGEDETFEMRKPQIKHTGHFAIITLEDGELKEIYAGNSQSVQYGKNKVSAPKGKVDFYATMQKGGLKIQ